MLRSLRSFTFLTGVAVVSSIWGLAGCEAQLEGEGTGRLNAGGAGSGDLGRAEPIENPPTIGETQVVTEAPEVLSSEENCIDLVSGEKLLGVDPNGIAWLATDIGDSHDIRAFDYREATPGEEFSVELAEIVEAQILGEKEASLLGPEGLWSFAAGELVAHALSFDEAANLCGDPFSNGAVLAAGRFMERRGSEWWAWEPSVPAASSLARLIDVAGECYDRNDGAWMLGADNRLWRVSSTDTQLLFSDVLSVGVTPENTGALTADSFYFGRDDWQRWTFANGTPERLLAGGDVIWLQSGNDLLRFDGEEFRILDRPEATPIDVLKAHAGGIWVQGGERLCHYETQESLRIAGLRPGERAEREGWSVDVEVQDAEEPLEAWLNDQVVDVSGTAIEGMQRLDLPDAHVGWNKVLLLQGTAERSLHFKRVPSIVRSWAEDIEPISEDACVTCHSSGGDAEEFPLETYDDWLARAADVRKRVVETQTMPPVLAPGWEDNMQIIAEWLEGGTNP